jgi:hypothetical protein
MYTIDEFRECLERVRAILNQCGIRYSVTGGAAFIAYGDSRTTQDVDLVVDVERLRQCLTEFFSLLAGQFLFSEATIRQAVKSGRQFQLIDLVSTFKLDLYPRELIAGELGRAVEIEIMSGLSLPIVSIPDLIASKLVWISKGSHKSRRDVKMLMRQASEDAAKLAREFAEQLGQLELLDEVLAEPDEIDA